MAPRRSSVRACLPPLPRPNRAASAAIATAAAAAAVLLAAGCSAGSGHPPAGGSATVCGTAHTVADIPVTVEVMRGQVACDEAVRIERDYTSAIQQAIKSGKFGNGGGEPIAVHGWTCQGFNTPTVDKTGKASKCTSGGNEIVAVLQLPSASPS